MINTPATVPDWLLRRKTTHPDVIALSTPSVDVTYRALYLRAVDMANELKRQNVTGYVGLLAKDGYAFALVVHALIQAEVVVVPLNWRLTSVELAWQVTDADIRFILHDDATRELAGAIAAEVATSGTGEDGAAAGVHSDASAMAPPVKLMDVSALIRDKSYGQVENFAEDSRWDSPKDFSGDPRKDPSEDSLRGSSRDFPGEMQLQRAIQVDNNVLSHRHIDLNTVHAIIYTSGTTGHPKGTQITYGNEWWSASGSALQLGVLPTDRWLVPMPLFHMGGLSVLLRSVIYGITAVIHNGFEVTTVNEAIDTGNVTLASLVPTMLQRMLDNRDGKPYPDTLRAILLGGSAASLPLLRAADGLGVRVAQSYGMTETASQVCTLPPRDFQRKLGSSGLPALMNDVIVVDEQAREKSGNPVQYQRPCGIPGEVIVRGPTVTPGYLGNPEATREALHSGWLWTGDIGYVDEEGYLYILDRRRDLIVSGGENIYPAQIESVLEGHSDVAEAAVVGVSDVEWGQIPVAVLTLRTGATVTASELTAFCESALARYKIPKQFVFVDKLPRNAAGKLLRRTLREWLESENKIHQQ